MFPRVTCPCCGHQTLSEGPGAYEVCPVCGWEDDGPSRDDPTAEVGGPNGISLAEAQRRYVRYGAFYPEDVDHRPARPDEPVDPAWSPAEDPAADELHDFLRDLVYIYTLRAESTRDAVGKGGDERARGRLDAWREVLTLVTTQADLFGLDPIDVGLPDQFDPASDLDEEFPTGRYTG